MNMNIIEIANKIKENGGNLYLVGGAVRDKLLGIESKDKDYCVTGLSKENFQELFPESFENGKAFPVFRIEQTEFALARRELKTGIGHKEFSFDTENVNIIEDLARRDITINSMAEEVLTKELIDPFGGQEDLKNKIIRATTNAFKEDPLRVYRVARFASTYDFIIEENTINLMNELKKELNTLSAERVFGELKKALGTKKPSLFFENLKKANVLEIHFKEIFDLIGAEQPEQFHPEGHAYNHTMIVVDKAAEFTDNVEVRFAALVHDFGKGITPKEKYPHHYGHDEAGVELVKRLGKRICLPTSYIKCGITAAKEHMRAGKFFEMKASTKVELIERVSKTILGLDGLQVVVNADRSDRKTYDFSEIGNRMLKEIDGKYIEEKYKIKPGIELGKILHNERVKWMKNIDNKEEKI